MKNIGLAMVLKQPKEKSKMASLKRRDKTYYAQY